jgi:hypothetical protein
MKNKLLSLCFFLASSLVAEEMQTPTADTPLPADIKMDPLKHVRKQLSAAREKGWDNVSEKKDQPQEKPKGLIEFNLSSSPANFQPMQKSEQMMSVFRNDVPESEKGIQMDRLNEADRKFKYPGKK